MNSFNQDLRDLANSKIQQDNNFSFMNKMEIQDEDTTENGGGGQDFQQPMEEEKKSKPEPAE